MKTKHRDEVKSIWSVTPTERKCVTKAYCKGNLVFENGRYNDYEEEYLLMVFSTNTSKFYIDDVEYNTNRNGIAVKIRKNSFYSNSSKTLTIALNSDVLDFRYKNELWMCIYNDTPTFANWPSVYTPTTTQKNNLTNFKTNVSTESKTINVIIPSTIDYCWGVKSGDTERYFADYIANNKTEIMGSNSYCSITVNYPNELQIFYGGSYATLQYHQLTNDSKYNVMNVSSSGTISVTSMTLPSNKLDLNTYGYNNDSWWNYLSPIKELEKLNWKLDRATLVNTTNFPSSFVFVPVDEYGRVLVNIQNEYSDLSNTPRFYWRHGIKIGEYFVDFRPYKSGNDTTILSSFIGSCCVVNRLSLFSTFKQYDKMKISLAKNSPEMIDYPYWNDVVAEMNEWTNSDVDGYMLFIPIKLTDAILEQLRNMALDNNL